MENGVATDRRCVIKRGLQKKKRMKLINGGYANGNHPQRKKMRMKERKRMTIEAKAWRKCERMGCKT